MSKIKVKQKLRLVLLCGAAFLISDAYAESCTSGTTCEFSSGVDFSATSQNAGSHLIYTNQSVDITTYGTGSVALLAKDSGKITFNQDVNFTSTASLGYTYWIDINSGGNVAVMGNMSVSAYNSTTNQIVWLQDANSALSINGDFNVTINKVPAGTNSATVSPIYISDGATLTVKGITNIDARYQSNYGTAFTSSGGVVKLNELYVTTTGGRAMQSGSGGYISSTGETAIISQNSTAIWIGDKSFISIGASEAETATLEEQWGNNTANNNSIVNIGSNATVTGGINGIQILSGSPETYVYIRGNVTAPVAVLGYDNPSSKEIVKVQGGTVTGDVLLLRGDDEYHLESGTQIGNINMGGGNDKLFVSGGSLTGIVNMGVGDDYAELSGGMITGVVNMEAGGHSTGVIKGTFDTTGFTRFDGGADGTSVDDTASLTIDNYLLSAYTNVPSDKDNKGVNLTNWTEINVTNNSTLTLTDTNFFNTSDMPVSANVLKIDATSTVIGAPDVTNQTIMADVINAGKLRLDGNSTVGDIWEIRGNYTGNDGTIVFDTQLGDDSSPTDFLHITGNASGTTGVQVINRGGLGALTTGDGIQLIQVDGTSSANNFALKSDYQFEGQNAVVGGAYAYSLYAGNQAGNFAGNWYLRSLTTETPPVNPTDPTNPVTPENPTNPEVPTNPVLPTPPTVPSNPVYQPGVALYEVYPQVLQQMNKLGTLEQRVGNRTWLGQHENSVDVADVTEGRGFWMKVEGSTSHINSNKSKTNANYDLNIVKTQLGLDFEALENDKGTLIGGVYFQYGHAKADISSRFGKGDIKTNGYGLGGTLTWYGNNGLYVDGVGQAMWYKSDINSDTLDRREADGNKGTGYALSIEAGKKIALNQEWTLTPQAQLSYNSVDFDSFHDAYKARVSRQDGDALTGRLGVSLDRETAWKSASGDMRRLKAYGIANLYYEFLDGTQVQVTGVKFRNQPDRFWGGLGAGLSHNWNDDKYSIYGEVDARSSFNDFGNSYSLNGTVGFRAKF